MLQQHTGRSYCATTARKKPSCGWGHPGASPGHAALESPLLTSAIEIPARTGVVNRTRVDTETASNVHCIVYSSVKSLGRDENLL